MRTRNLADTITRANAVKSHVDVIEDIQVVVGEMLGQGANLPVMFSATGANTAPCIVRQ